MTDNTFKSPSMIPLESIHEMAESVGIYALTEDAAKELSDDVSYRLKSILHDAAKFMHHGVRNKMMSGDIDRSLSARDIEPHFGFHQLDNIPFRFSSGGGVDLPCNDDLEVDLAEMVLAPLPKLPLDVTLRTHWLCVEGVQPTVPENPPPLSREAQKLESVDPIRKLSRASKDTIGQPLSSKAARLRATQADAVQQIATHELSVEQQLYYKEITEACVGSDETKRAEALQSLSVDPGLHEMLPRVCTFISEGVKVNVVQNNLALLIYLMRMVKALLDNPSLYLEKYLHELIPSISTCIVSRQLCSRPEDNHWALRDFASRLMAQICKTFNTSTNNLQTRVTRLFSRALVGSGDKSPLPSLYGAIQGLSELGPEVIKVLILSNVPLIGNRVKPYLEGSSSGNFAANKVAASNIRNQFLKVLPPIIKNLRQPPDLLEEFISDYGYFGPDLFCAIEKARVMPTTPLTPKVASLETLPLTNNPTTSDTSVAVQPDHQHFSMDIESNQIDIADMPGTSRMGSVLLNEELAETEISFSNMSTSAQAHCTELASHPLEEQLPVMASSPTDVLTAGCSGTTTPKTYEDNILYGSQVGSPSNLI